MRIDFVPKNYTPIEQGLLFGFTTESDEPTDVTVEIIDAASGEVVATQQLLQVVSGVVNIAPYVERFSEREPLTASVAISSLAEAESARYKIRIGDVESQEVVVSPVRCEVETSALITEMPTRRRVARGDCDELLFMVGAATDVEVAIVPNSGAALHLSMPNAQGVMRLVVATGAFEKATSLTLRISLNGEVWSEVEYDVRPTRKHALRMVWESACGSFERYTFLSAYAVRREVEKQRVGNGKNLDTVSAIASESLKVMSNYEPQGLVATLSDIIAAPRVWIECKGGLERVDVLTTEVGYSLFDEPDYVELELRREKRRLSLW